MKRLLFILSLFAVLSCSVEEKHLPFMGIPIDGTLEEFTSQLQDKGFVVIESGTDSAIVNRHLNYAVLEGQFIDKNVKLKVTATPISNKPWRLDISLPSHIDDFNGMYEERKEVIRMFKDKYPDIKRSETEQLLFDEGLITFSTRDNSSEVSDRRLEYELKQIKAGRPYLDKKWPVDYWVELVYVDNLNMALHFSENDEIDDQEAKERMESSSAYNDI